MVDFNGSDESRPFPIQGPAYMADALIVPPEATGFEQSAAFIPEGDRQYRQGFSRVNVEGHLIHHEQGGGSLAAEALYDRLPLERFMRKRTQRLARIILITSDEFPPYDPAS